MDEFDEYGNYLGQVLESSEEEEEEEEPRHIKTELEEEEEEETNDIKNSIVLYEDKALYPSASSVFGEDVEIVLSGQVKNNRMQITQPLLPKEDIVKQTKKKRAETEATTAEAAFNEFIYSTPELIRTISVVGHLQHGKSGLVSLLHRKTKESEEKMMKTCNVRKDEQSLQISLKLRPISSCCADSNEKSYWIQSIDTPGHLNFLDEAECALEISDGAILVVDVIEGIQIGTELAVKSLRNHGLLDQTIVCFTKMDRLIHELKLPPADAARKLFLLLEGL